MTLHVVHRVRERDSDTGHDTYYSSEVLGIFETKEQAEQLVKDVKENTCIDWAQIEEIEIGKYPAYVLSLMASRKKAAEDRASGKPEPEFYWDLD